jgi:L-asparaginase II
VVRNGRVERSRGDLEFPVFYRSAAKPIQTLAVIESGAADRFAFTDEELAMVVGSHDGAPHNARLATSMLEKAGEGPELLRCGGHRSLNREVYEEYVRQGYRWGRLEDNCSGKHAGMIAAAKVWGEDPSRYVELDSRIQRENVANVSLLTGVDEKAIPIATDGCAAPSCAVPVDGMALAMARITTPDDLPEAKAAAADRIMRVVQKHPDMVAGPKRFDTRVVRAGKGRILAKMGAEGVEVLGVGGERLGIAVKIVDGGRRAVEAVVAALLIDLGILAREDLADYYERPVLSREGDPVGEIEVAL